MTKRVGQFGEFPVGQFVKAQTVSYIGPSGDSRALRIGKSVQFRTIQYKSEQFRTKVQKRNIALTYRPILSS